MTGTKTVQKGEEKDQRHHTGGAAFRCGCAHDGHRGIHDPVQDVDRHGHADADDAGTGIGCRRGRLHPPVPGE